MFLTSQYAEIDPCMPLFRNSRHKPNLESISNMVSPDLGGKMATFWVCACKLSWTLFARLKSVPMGGGKKWDFRDWTNVTMEDKFHSRYVFFFLIYLRMMTIKVWLFIAQTPALSYNCLFSNVQYRAPDFAANVNNKTKLYYSITMTCFRFLWIFNYPLFSL